MDEFLWNFTSFLYEDGHRMDVGWLPSPEEYKKLVSSVIDCPAVWNESHAVLFGRSAAQ